MLTASPPLLIRGLYGMTDPGAGDVDAQIALLVDEGVAPIQVRCKGWSRDALRALAMRWRRRITLVVNDHAALADELGLVAHLGQDDGPARGAHGRSTHTLDQVTAATDALYLGFGPIFPTSTKDAQWPPRGCRMLAEAVRATTLPIVAIGGITPANIDEVRGTGVAAWAVIGAIWRSPAPRAVIRALR